MNNVSSVKFDMTTRYRAGRETALGDFRAGVLSKPRRGDNREWARGYSDAVRELASTFGRDRIVAMGGKLA